MYKEPVLIPPLIKQDDTITISACGTKTQSMNTMIRTCANIMGLQFGREKCVLAKGITLKNVVYEKLTHRRKKYPKTKIENIY